MGDTIIIADDEPKPAKPAEVIVVTPEPAPKVEKVVTEKTTVTEIKPG
jgi:hypothetical protein